MKALELRRIARELKHSASYEAWRELALTHDELSGATKWKEEEQTRSYDYAAIRSRLDQLRYFRKRRDNHGLLFALNEGIHGNMGHMGRAELYERAMVGTKRLITEYVDEIIDALRHLSTATLENFSDADRLDFFRRASICFGRSGLLLSGGGVYGNFHVGVIKVLLEQDLMPRVISGASAGSLIAAIVCTHSREQLLQTFEARHLQIRTRRAARGLSRGVSSLFPRFGFEDVRNHVERLIPDLTFAEAYQRTGLSLNVSISPAEVHQTPRLMNAITSPNVYVRSAVLASCAVPGIYPAVSLLAKNRHGEPQPYLPGRKWVDGSVSDDVPARRLSRLYGVNHYIVSQVNPFALLHRPLQHSATMTQDLQQFLFHSSKNTAQLVQRMTDKYSRRWPELRYNINTLMSVWMQDYHGDINILPPVGLVRPWKGMTQPSEELLLSIIRAGEHASWPRVEMIRNCTRIGRALEDICIRLEDKPHGASVSATRIDMARWTRRGGDAPQAGIAS